MLRVFSMKVTKDIPDRWCKAYLSETRKQEAKKRKSDRDRRLFLAAEVLLNRSLEAVKANIMLPAAYTRNPYGKPYLLPPAELYVNWSHSGDSILCALSDREVGIALQEMQKEPREALVARTLQPEELCFYQTLPSEQRKQVFYQYWTLKESYLKALGTGFHTSLASFYIEMDKSHPRIVQRAKGRLYHCRLLPMDDKYMAALCVEGEEREELDQVRIEAL